MRSHANGLMQRHLQRVQSKRAVRCARPMTNVRINVSNAIGVRVWQDRPANWPRPGDCHEQRYGSKEDREEKAPEDIAGETCSQKGEEGEQEVNASPSHPSCGSWDLRPVRCVHSPTPAQPERRSRHPRGEKRSTRPPWCITLPSVSCRFCVVWCVCWSTLYRDSFGLWDLL